jgi:hypothetical protein
VDPVRPDHSATLRRLRARNPVLQMPPRGMVLADARARIPRPPQRA